MSGPRSSHQMANTSLGNPQQSKSVTLGPSFPISRPATALVPHSWTVSHSGNQICSSKQWKPLHEAGLAANLARGQSCLQLHPQQLAVTQQKFPCSPYRRHLRTWSSDDQRRVCYSLSGDVLCKAISLRMRNVTKLSDITKWKQQIRQNEATNEHASNEKQNKTKQKQKQNET